MESKIGGKICQHASWLVVASFSDNLSKRTLWRVYQFFNRRDSFHDDQRGLEKTICPIGSKKKPSEGIEHMHSLSNNRIESRWRMKPSRKVTVASLKESTAWHCHSNHSSRLVTSPITSLEWNLTHLFKSWASKLSLMKRKIALFRGLSENTLSHVSTDIFFRDENLTLKEIFGPSN